MLWVLEFCSVLQLLEFLWCVMGVGSLCVVCVGSFCGV